MIFEIHSSTLISQSYKCLMYGNHINIHCTTEMEYKSSNREIYLYNDIFNTQNAYYLRKN